MTHGFQLVRVSGYLLSMGGTILLAIPALVHARGEPLLLASIVAGVTMSLAGIGMRWHSHRLEQRGRGGE